jgi:hypothetical protein
MLRSLRYFFLRVYEFKRRSEPEGLAAFTAVCATSVALGCHVLALWILYRETFGVPAGMAGGRRAAQALGAGVMLIIAAAFYSRWVSSGRYLSFREEFQAETPDQRQWRSVFVILYAAISFLLPVVLMISFAP